jgi:hypothetical protein
LKKSDYTSGRIFYEDDRSYCDTCYIKKELSDLDDDKKLECLEKIYQQCINLRSKDRKTAIYALELSKEIFIEKGIEAGAKAMEKLIENLRGKGSSTEELGEVR